MIKKLLYIANVRLPTEKAHGIQIMKMCEAFAGVKGVDVELIIPWRFNRIKEDPFLYYNVEKNFTITKIPSCDLIALGKIGFFLQVFSFALFASAYALVSKNINLIYSRDEVPLFFLSFFRENIFWEAHIEKENFFVRRVVRKAKGIIAVTQGFKNLYRTKNNEEGKVLVAHDGVDLRRCDSKKSKEELRGDLDLPRDKKIVGYIGKYKTMGEPKGVDELIISFSEVLSFLPDAFLLLVGINENEVVEVERVLRRAQVGREQYMIVPHVSQQKAFLYMKASDVLVMNYPDTPHYSRYMSPLKLFEYMASGVPIVASDLPSLREVLDENDAVFFNPNQSQALKDALVRVSSDLPAFALRAKNARMKVENYTWRARAEHIFEFMDKQTKKSA